MSKGNIGRTLGGKGTKACADLNKRASQTPDNTQGSRVSGRLDKKRRMEAGIEEEAQVEAEVEAEVEPEVEAEAEVEEEPTAVEEPASVEVEVEIDEGEAETVGQHTPVPVAGPHPLASGGTYSPLDMVRFAADQAKIVEQMALNRAEKDMYHGAPGIDKRAEEANEASYQAMQVLLEAQQQQQQQKYELQRIGQSIDMLEARLVPANFEGLSEEALNVSAVEASIKAGYPIDKKQQESFNSYFDGKPPTIKSTTKSGGKPPVTSFAKGSSKGSSSKSKLQEEQEPSQLLVRSSFLPCMQPLIDVVVDY
ncbi:hypothetical protein B484DRAFT_391197 [Ochromonadaceae sp. CCMP2298]|nr:hypothetical protein B484DRAFT_391197 [Ochromonadaceae sp. CCMP2298]